MIQDIQPHRLFNHYDTEAVPGPDSVILHFSGRDVFALNDEKHLAFPTYQMLSEEDRLRDTIYLFRLDDTAYFLLMEQQKLSMDGYTYISVRETRKKDPGKQELVFALWTAYHLSSWYNSSRYCGRCASPMVPAGNERAMVCSSCGFRNYPRINPAVIIGVTNKDKLLMTKYADRPLAFYALVAGFTEIGETFEQTVEREVMEEVGLKVKNIRYYKSQPWAIDLDILAGFYCDVDGDDTIRIDHQELKEGAWFAREDIMGQPDGFSLTHEMMITFRDGKEPKS